MYFFIIMYLHFYILHFNKIVQRMNFFSRINYKTKHLDRKEIHVFEYSRAT